MERKLIKLRQDLAADAWIANFEGDEKVRKLFGTTILPTPFAASVDASIVLERVQKLNPDCKVLLA